MTQRGLEMEQNSWRCCQNTLAKDDMAKLTKRQNFTTQLKPKLIPYHCITHIQQCQKAHSDTNWHIEHHQSSKTYGDETKTQWQKPCKINQNTKFHKKVLAQP